MFHFRPSSLAHVAFMILFTSMNVTGLPISVDTGIIVAKDSLNPRPPQMLSPGLYIYPVTNFKRSEQIDISHLPGKKAFGKIKDKVKEFIDKLRGNKEGTGEPKEPPQQEPKKDQPEPKENQQEPKENQEDSKKDQEGAVCDDSNGSPGPDNSVKPPKMKGWLPSSGSEGIYRRDRRSM